MIEKLALAIVMMTAGMLALKFLNKRADGKKTRVKAPRRRQYNQQNRVENLVWDEQTQTYRVKH